MKAYDLINILSAIPKDFNITLNGEYEIDEVNIYYPNETVSLVVPDLCEWDEEEI